MKIRYYIAKVLSKLTKNNELMNNYYRGCGAKIGERALICTDIGGNESCLIEIGDDTTISVNVAFVTHDFSVKNLAPGMNNIFGKITIGNNCFVGRDSVLMYGITLGDNIIVVAGSVVTHSFKDERIIIGGNPAKIIGTWDSFYEKVKDKSLSRYHLKKSLEEHPEKFITRN